MRKHFLILMLLTLLPFTGWAAEPTNITGGVVTLSATTSQYDGSAVTGITVVKVEVGTTYDAVTTGLNITSWKNENGQTVTELKDAGVYTCTVQADGKTGSAVGTYTITKKPVTLAVDDKSITFGASLPTFTLTYTGLVDADIVDPTAPKKTPKDGVFVGTITYTAQKAGVDYVAGNPTKGAVGDYAVVPNFSALTSKNYDFTPTNGTLTVNKKNITAGMLGTIAPRIYNGSDYTPTPVLTDAVLTTEGHVFIADDFVATYHKTEALADGGTAYTAGDLTNAGTYWIKIAGAGNYKGSIKASYTVTKKDLAISTVSASTEYGTAPTLTLAARATFDGLVTADKDGNNQPKAAAYVGGAVLLSIETWQAGVKVAKAEEAVGDYDIVAVSSAADDVTFVNYNPIYFNGGVLTVEQKELLFTIKNQSKKEGTTHALDNAAGVTPTAANKDSYFTTISALGVTGDAITVYPTLTKGDLVEGKTNVYEIDANTSAVRVVRTVGLDVIDVTANYDIKATSTATYTIEAGQINVKPVNRNINYGDAAQSIDVTLVGVSSDDLATAKAAILKAFAINKTGAAINDAGEVIAGTVTYPNAGIYAIEYDATKLDLGTLADKYSVKAFNGTYTIAKRELKSINPLAQTVLKDAGVTALEPASATTVEFVKKDNDTYNITDTDKRLLYEDIIAADATNSIGFTFTASTASAGTKEDAISVLALTNKLRNFKALARGTADLIVAEAAAATVTFYRADPNGTTIKSPKTVLEGTGAGLIDGKIATVKFDSRVLAAQKWNSFILPFDITPYDMCTALGCYAVFNVLNENSTADNIRFSLNMATIPANTPFLMKTYEEVDMKDVTFAGVLIQKPANYADAVTESAAAGAVKFTGIYEKTAMADNTYSFPVNDDWKSGGTGVNLRALSAYLKKTNANARIFVEDENGAVTEIETINADGVAVAKDGWFTLNGVRLQGVPTEKGVYINNGKKVVIK